MSTRWGVTRDIYCPKEETFAFLEDVLTEVMEIFPSPYIHIGGDEAPKAAWEESELAQEVIRREGLADEEELQSWFIRRIEGFLNANGRRLVGWDEILEGGLAPDATVMSWRGEAGGIQAAREGHDVIMTPNSHLYLDYYQGDTSQEPLAIGGFTPLEKVYAYEPVPADLTSAEAPHVLGAQGNVWTEYMSDHGLRGVHGPPPDAGPLGGGLVSHRPDGIGRVSRNGSPPIWPRLEAQGVNFRIPDVLGLEEDRLSLEDSALVELSGAVTGGEIRYTLDGTDPGAGSPRYEAPFLIPVDEDGTEVAARVYLEDGRAGAVKRSRFMRTHLLPPTSVPLNGRTQGLAVQGFAGRFRSVDEIEGGDSFDLPDILARTSPSLPRFAIPDGVSESILRPDLQRFHSGATEGDLHLLSLLRRRKSA